MQHQNKVIPVPIDLSQALGLHAHDKRTSQNKIVQRLILSELESSPSPEVKKLVNAYYDKVANNDYEREEAALNGAAQ